MDRTDQKGRWYTGVTRYQWLVLVIASLGWVFDVFEGQIFVASMNEAMPDLLPAGARELDFDARAGRVALYNNITFGAFLLGGAVGGVLFGVLSDRIGRTKTMTYTIIMYSAFTFISALAQAWWQMAAFRFLVAMGVGGEWAVASTLVAEVFPNRARACALAIFHASSVLGTYLAIAAGTWIIANPAFQNTCYPSLPWRVGFAVGVLPALLIIWVRRSLREPDHWEQSRRSTLVDLKGRLGSFSELFGALAPKTVIGVGLAAVGLATFWGAHIYGKDLLRGAVEERLATDAGAETVEAKQLLWRENGRSIKRWEMLGMFLVTTGGGLGLVAFGPICELVGRRGAFFLFHLGGLAGALVVFGTLHAVNALLVALPIFGFLTLGMHAGYAVYFPELFPTRLRSTGAGFCFNMGRVIAAPILFANGWLQGYWDLSLRQSASLLSLLFFIGIGLTFFAPETRGQELLD